jgi:hypothetical protein
MCTLSGASWAGGGVTNIEWEDGVQTAVRFGLQGRGERPCPKVGVDGVRGEWSFPYALNFSPLTDEQVGIALAEQLALPRCIDINSDSVCWAMFN